MQKITLDINPKGEIPFLYFSQYDNGRLFQIELVDGELAYELPVEYNVQLNVRKTDSKLVTKAPDSIVDNILTFSTTEQMTACAGENIGSVTLKDADDIVITTLYFLISVQRDVLAGGLDSASEIYNLEQQIAAIVPEVIGDDYYNKSETDALLADKADRTDLTDLASKAEVTQAISDEDISLKNWAFSNFATPGYIANRYYNKTQVDELLFNMLPIGSASGNPCTFSTDLADALVSLTAEIVCGGGGGTPSTPIPIVGHTELNLTRCGVNLWDEETVISNSRLKSKNAIPVEPNKTYRYINGADIYASIDVVNANGGYISFVGNIQAGNTFTTPADCHYLAFTVATAYGTTYNNDISINYPATDTTYHAYNGQTFTVAFGQTVYGGVYDANSGKVKPNVYYPSYNGETITGRWLSSKDVYVEGNTPTTGAQVVCLDEYDTEIVVPSISVNAENGTNNITSDCIGDVNVSYKDTIQHYIDQRVQ